MARTPKPQSLRPMSKQHRLWLIGLLVVAGVIVVIGWKMTIARMLTYVPQAQEVIDEQIDKAAEQIGGAEEVVGEKTSDLSESFQQMKSAYEAEKALQAEEDTTSETENP